MERTITISKHVEPPWELKWLYHLPAFLYIFHYFLDTVVFKGERFKNESILDIKTHYRSTETFQYTHFNSCHSPDVKNGFIKGEAMRLLRTNSLKSTF